MGELTLEKPLDPPVSHGEDAATRVPLTTQTTPFEMCLNLKLSGNEVYHTARYLLVMFEESYSKLYRQKVLD